MAERTPDFDGGVYGRDAFIAALNTVNAPRWRLWCARRYGALTCIENRDGAFAMYRTWRGVTYLVAGHLFPYGGL